MKTTIWLATTYLQRWEDTQKIQKALQAVYGSSVIYNLGSWLEGGAGRLHYLELESVSKSKAQERF